MEKEKIKPALFSNELKMIYGSSVANSCFTPTYIQVNFEELLPALTFFQDLYKNGFDGLEICYYNKLFSVYFNSDDITDYVAKNFVKMFLLADEELINLILAQKSHYWVWKEYELSIKKGDLGFLCSNPASLHKYLVEIVEDCVKYYLGGKSFFLTKFKVIDEVEDKSLPLCLNYGFNNILDQP